MLRLTDGVSLRDSAKEIGVSYETFRRWRMEQSAPTRLRPVTARKTSARRSELTDLRVVTVSGHRVEGLELAQLIELLRQLG